jgi:predicted nucleic acid-binding protein
MGGLSSLLSMEMTPIINGAADALNTLALPLITIWAVIAEAMYRLHQVAGLPAQQILWGYINDGLLAVAEMVVDRRRWTQHYMQKYADRPCDLADASLLALAETLPVRCVLTIDGDFT